MEDAVLTRSDQSRLEELAKEAGRPPQEMLGFVLRDGFDYCEHVVKSVNEGMADPEVSSLDEVAAGILARRNKRDRAAA
jgi:hypothetical protein